MFSRLSVNVVDCIIKDNTAKAMETIARDAASNLDMSYLFRFPRFPRKFMKFPVQLEFAPRNSLGNSHPEIPQDRQIPGKKILEKIFGV